MSTWLRSGTATFTDNSAIVTFTGVDLLASNINAGDAIHAPNGEIYEVASVDSATQLTLAQPYRLQTGYAIQPTRGIVAALRDAVQTQITQINAHLSGILSGRFLDGSKAAPSITFAGDQDTGMYRPATNTVAFSAGGVDALKLTATSASGGAVQSSTTDATAGKLMTVGAFGLGGVAAGHTGDLNDITVSGAYQFDSSSLNAPPFTANGIVWHGARTSSIHTQIAISRGNGSEGRISGRSKSETGVWSDWATPYEPRTILGSVSQSSGIPTGAVIERGYNSNGEYVRYADGTQICWRPSITLQAASDVTWTFPAAFASAPAVSGVGITNADRIITTAGAVGGSSVALRAWAMQSSPARSTTPASVMAIGRWF